MAFSAFNAAKSGLEAYETKFNDHAHNLASAGSVAGKERETFITSLQPSNGSLSSVASGVQSSLQNYIQNVGLPAPSQVATHVAISGNGFALVRDTETTSGELLYTRVGTFDFDDKKIARNHLGKYLQVFLVDPDTGNPTSGGTDTTSLVPLDISNVVLNPVATNSMSISYQFSANITPSDTESERTINTTVQVFDSRGNTQTLPIEFERISATTADGGDGITPNASTSSLWAMRVTAPTGGSVNPPYDAATGDGMIIEFDNTGSPVTFRDGSFAEVSTPPALQVTWPDGVGAATSTIALNMGTIGQKNGIYSAGNSNVYKSIVSDNGNAPGSFQDFFWDEDGFGWIKYTNGDSKRYCRMPLANFDNPNGLSIEKDAMYTASAASGGHTINFPKEGTAGTLVPRHWESSTTNGVSVYVKMIQDQKYYMGQLNVIKTVKEMLEAVERVA